MDKIMRMVNGNKKFEENKEIKNFLIVITIFIVILALMLFMEFHSYILVLLIGLIIVDSLISLRFKRNKLHTEFLGCYCCSYFNLKHESCIYTGSSLEGNFNICIKFVFNRNVNELALNIKTLEEKYSDKSKEDRYAYKIPGGQKQ